ncbi:MAG: hypothetical protein QOH85_1966, partial [Acidobacteriaceae bacterium]|nr:hypothetical protein [Acidobacteriaceae bacterium]
MRLRTRATRRPIVPGLLLAGLCTLTAAAQQSTPTTVLAQDAASPANAKPQVHEQRSSEEQESSKNTAPAATTGVSNPDATPATTDADTAMPPENGSVADASPAKPAADAVTGDVAQTAPATQASSATATANSSVIAVKTEANAAAQTSHPPVAESTQETGETAMPGGSEHPAGPAAAAVPESPGSE